MGVGVTSGAAGSNGKMAKHAGHLNDTSANLISCADLAGPSEAQRAGRTLFLGARARRFRKQSALDSAGE